MSLTDLHFPHITLHRTFPFEAGRQLAAVALPMLTVGATSFARDVRDALHPDESELAERMTPFSQATFVAGRMALRAAIAAIDPELARAPILRSTRGAPMLPPGIAGSVSHTRRLAVALTDLASDPRITLGVDVEELPTTADIRRPDIARRILTPREREQLPTTDRLLYRRATVVRFALKEAIYKAIDPIVQRYVGFTEVEVDVDTGGSARVTLLLPELRNHPLRIRAAWREIGHHILATAVTIHP